MSYKDDLELFKKRKEKEAKKLNGEALISWYLTVPPFGLYYAAEQLWKQKGQRDKDDAIRYYKKFVLHNDIREQGAEVKKAISILLKAYRTGYGSRDVQYEAAQSLEQRLQEKGFKFAKGIKKETDPDRTQTGTIERRKNTILQAIGTAATIAAAAVSIVPKIMSHFSSNDKK